MQFLTSTFRQSWQNRFLCVLMMFTLEDVIGVMWIRKVVNAIIPVHHAPHLSTSAGLSEISKLWPIFLSTVLLPVCILCLLFYSLSAHYASCSTPCLHTMPPVGLWCDFPVGLVYDGRFVGSVLGLFSCVFLMPFSHRITTAGQQPTTAPIATDRW